MAGWLVLIVVLAAVAFLAGWILASRRPAQVMGATTDLVPVGSPAGPSALSFSSPSEAVVRIGDEDHLALALVHREVAQPDGSIRAIPGRTLAPGSALVGAFGDVGAAAAATRGLYRVTFLGAAADALANGTGAIKVARDGELLAEVADKATGQVVGKGRLSDPNSLVQLSPTIVWTALAFVVGQHFQVEVSARLGAIEQRLEQINGRLERRHDAALAAATQEVVKMAARLLDGDAPDRVDQALNTQIHCIESRWQEALAELTELERQMATARGREDLHANDLAEVLPAIFGDEETTTAVLQRLLQAIRARLLLLAVRVPQAASIEGGGRYQALLREDLDQTRAIWNRLRTLSRDLARLEYSVDSGRFRKADAITKSIEATRMLAAVNDELDAIRLPLLSPHVALPAVTIVQDGDSVRLAIESETRDRESP